jgi:hypothetical protein
MRFTINFTRPCPLGIGVGKDVVRGTMSVLAYDRDGAQRAAGAILREWCNIVSIEEAKEGASEARSPAKGVEVTVPGLERQMSRAETSFWDLTGSALGDMIEALGEQMAISLWASRLTRELRRRHGLQATQDMLRQMAETMPTVSLYDDDPKAMPS